MKFTQFLMAQLLMLAAVSLGVWCVITGNIMMGMLTLLLIPGYYVIKVTQ